MITSQAQSQGSGLLKKAIETVKCYKSLFEYYERLYIDHAPNILKLKKLKLSVYKAIQGKRVIGENIQKVCQL